MNTLLSRYLEGELDEQEAREFLEALERDPHLARELRQTERILAAGRLLVDESLPPGFTAELMDRLEPPAEARRATAVPLGRWLRPVAAAAVLALAFLGGMRVGPDSPAPDPVAEVSTPALHSVRLVYVPPADQDVRQVHVAGDFNGWSETTTPLRQVDGVWTATLVLPPGDYEYMFVENGKRWVTDPLASRTRADGLGV